MDKPLNTTPVGDIILRKASRHLLPCLASQITGVELFPLRIGFSLPTRHRQFEDLAAEVQALQKLERKANEPGLRLVWKLRKTRALGTQTLPIEAWLDRKEDLLSFLKAWKKAELFDFNLQALETHLPECRNWLMKPTTWPKLINPSIPWPDLSRATRFLLDQDSLSSFYIRDLPLGDLGLDTKFVERYNKWMCELMDHCLPKESIDRRYSSFHQRYRLQQDNPHIRVRLLDESLMSRLGIPFRDFSCPAQELNQALQGPQAFRSLESGFWEQIDVLVIENKTTFLRLPPQKNTLAFFGCGFLAETFGSLDFLKHTRLFYWGDIDKEGLEILARFTQIFPHTQPLFMSAEVFSAHQHLAVKGSGAEPRMDSLALLSDDLIQLYRHLTSHNLRLEQERLDIQLQMPKQS